MWSNYYVTVIVNDKSVSQLFANKYVYIWLVEISGADFLFP